MQEEESEQPSTMPADDSTPLFSSGRGGSVHIFDDYVRPVFTEFFATLMFVFTGVMVSWGGQEALVCIALGHGLTIALLVAATGPISGGHINPAVTFGCFIAGAIAWQKAICYVIGQLLGGILGASIARGILSFPVPSANNVTAFVSINGGGQQLASGVSLGEGYGAETMMTMLLVGAVLIAAVESDGDNPLAPLAIGFAVAVDILGGGHVTGASMNPARSFGPAVAASGLDSVELWKDHWIYWVGPLSGAAIVAILYKIFIASPDKRWILKHD